MMMMMMMMIYCCLTQQGVVVVEDIAKLNHLLRVPNQQPAVLLSSLEQLSQKLPSREILKSTKIGCFAVYW